MGRGFTVRPSTAADTGALARLMADLRYRTSEAEMIARLDPIVTHPDYQMLVAEVAGQVAGMVGLIREYFYERNGPYVRIAALVVDRRHRRKGVGSALVAAAEGWAGERGAVAILLNSGRHRTDAHRFYRHLGYEESGVRFHKMLE